MKPENGSKKSDVVLLQKYFPELTTKQLQQFSSLGELYRVWNEKINVISRKDIDHLYERHVLHSLAIAKFISFKAGTRILDAGTGGGFPGIPLAIFFPDVKFHLIDSVGKKIKVVSSIAESLQLKNVIAEKIRAEDLDGDYDFILSRAVASIKTLYDWTKHLISPGSNDHGWIFLKGGDLQSEIQELRKPVQQVAISDYFDEEFFREKFIVYFH